MVSSLIRLTLFLTLIASAHSVSLTSSITFFQSEIEEALVRIKELEGVEGYVICNNDGTVLRHQVDMSKKVAEDLARVSLFCRGCNAVSFYYHYYYHFSHHRYPSLLRPPTTIQMHIIHLNRI